MKNDHIRRLNVDLSIDGDEELSSPPPNGAKFNWKTLKLEIPKGHLEKIVPLEPITQHKLVRSAALSPDSWKSAIEARKALLFKDSQELAKPDAEKSFEDVELAGEGE